MAPNGTSLSRKTPAMSKPSKAETNGITLDSMFDDLREEAEAEVKEDVKKALPAVKKPGNWDSEVVSGNKPKDSSTRASPATMNKVTQSIAKAFPNSRPMTDKPDILKCNHCKRAVSKHAMAKHVEGCLNKRQEKQRKKKEAKDARDAAARKERNGTVGDSDEEDDEGGKKTTGDKTGLSASKKRKAGEGDDGAPAKKKKKKDEKAKPPKPKAPVDVEKQCGVELPNGGQCARSLTCKSHSMGAKRAVRRSKSYDTLLLEYQRKNQAKLQKAQFDARAPNPEDENLPSGPVDSDEEKDTMMSAVQRFWGGSPLYNTTHAPLASKYQHNRIKGMLQSALGGRNGANLFGTSASGSASGGGFFGPPAPPVIDDQGIVHARRGSAVIPGARSMVPLATGSRGAGTVAT